MDFRTISVLIFCFLYLVKYHSFKVIIIDFKAEMDKIYADMNITSPTAQDEMFAKKIIDERITKEEALEKQKEKEDTIREKEDTIHNLTRKLGNLETEKKSVEDDLDRLKVLVIVRNIRDRMQEKWTRPSKCEKCLEYGHPTSLCKAQQAKKSKNPNEEKLRDMVRYWVYLEKEYHTDPDFILLNNELQLAYANRSQQFLKFSFEEYQQMSYRCLGIACGITDSKVHIDVIIKQLKQLNVFGCPVDEFMKPYIRALGLVIDPNLPPVIYESSETTSESTSLTT